MEGTLPVLWIRGILLRIWIRGSVPLTYGDPAPDPAYSVADKMPTKNYFFFKVILLITFLMYIYISFHR
jgi:hypothetical protein